VGASAGALRHDAGGKEPFDRLLGKTCFAQHIAAVLPERRRGSPHTRRRRGESRGGTWLTDSSGRGVIVFFENRVLDDLWMREHTFAREYRCARHTFAIEPLDTLVARAPA